MPDDSQQSDRLSRFLTEFKRRKVGRVISVYAAAAFVTLELFSIVVPSLGMPDWTMKVVIILLSAGFVISAILAWIFDRNPEGGLVRTPSAGESKVDPSQPQEKPATSNRWKLATYLSLTVIVLLTLYNVLTVWLPGKRDSALTIAVLPFRNDSPDREKDFIINGLLEAILNNLSKVENMHVVSRTSIETYRGSNKSAREIGELKAILTPEEREGIEKKPSENMAATNLYLQA